uniref:Oligodendrocyte myelin glycoprotein b n=1 Tax=Seriola lalandi dorsalis TaxID=1841481 RepID=A0A3B4Y611_SERLL
MPACSSSLLCLILLLLGGWVLSICPPVCLCRQGHRVVDCSSRGLTKLPPGLQHNIHFLNLIDLSHNYLVQILPGSLDRLPRLAQFYLHANRFSWLSEGVFDKLTGLDVMTLGDNPWACEEEENITRLLRWAEQTRATVLGHDSQSPARTAEVTSSYQAKSSGDNLLVWTSSTTFDSFSTSTTTRPPPSTMKKLGSNLRATGTYERTHSFSAAGQTAAHTTLISCCCYLQAEVEVRVYRCSVSAEST